MIAGQEKVEADQAMKSSWLRESVGVALHFFLMQNSSSVKVDKIWQKRLSGVVSKQERSCSSTFTLWIQVAGLHQFSSSLEATTECGIDAWYATKGGSFPPEGTKFECGSLQHNIEGVSEEFPSSNH